MDVLHLPHVVDDELLRLPPADEGQPAHAEVLHNEGDATPATGRSYNFQVLRDDVFMLGRDGTVKRRPIVPVRSARRGAGRARRTPTASGSTPSSRRSPPRATAARRSTRTSRTRCAARRRRPAPTATSSTSNDNNAWMAQLLLQGTNFVNFFGRYVYVARGRGRPRSGRGDRARRAAGGDRRDLHKLAYPEEFAAMPRLEPSPFLGERAG